MGVTKRQERKMKIAEMRMYFDANVSIISTSDSLLLPLPLEPHSQAAWPYITVLFAFS